MAKDISKLIRPQVKDLRAYHVDEPDVPVKLHANESPFNLPLHVIEKISQELSSLDFNRYPDPECTELRRLFAARLSVGTNQLLLGNGSDELIQMIMMAFGGHDASVVFPFPTFSMYRNIAMSAGEPVSPVPLDSSFELDMSAMKAELEKGPSVTFISYPNNPTGNCFSEEAIEEIINASEGIVVVDEAYFDYSGKTFIEKLKDYPNLIILRTLSKIGLAALRLGVLIASKEIVDIINRVRLPYNINALSNIAATVSLMFSEEIENSVREVKVERDRLYSLLKDMKSLETFKTDSNFILFRVDDAGKVFTGLIKKGVLIRNLNSDGPLKNCLRVTIGKSDENDAFMKAIRDL